MIGSKMINSSTFVFLSLKIYRQKIPGRWLENVESRLLSKLEKIRDHLGKLCLSDKRFEGRYRK